MKTERDRKLKAWYRETEALLPLDRRGKKKILSYLRGGVEAYLSENPEASAEELKMRFGTSKEIANACIGYLTAEEIRKLTSPTRKVIALALAGAVIALMMCAAVSINALVGNKARAPGGAGTTLPSSDGLVIEGGTVVRYEGSGEYVLIPDGVTAIGESAFENCRELVCVDIPDSVAFIGESAFHYCTRLEKVRLPAGLEGISGRLFQSCTSLTVIELPNSVSSIGGYAFCDCSSLTGITVPEGVRVIDGGAFNGCGGLTAVTLPRSLKTIGRDAFYVCSRLRDIYYGGSETEWEEIKVWDNNIAPPIKS